MRLKTITFGKTSDLSSELESNEILFYKDFNYECKTHKFTDK